MGIKLNNEVTVKVTSSKEELIKILSSKGFIPTRTFTLDDYYFIPKDLNITNMTSREVLTKAILVRNVTENNVSKKLLTFKTKEIDINGEVINQTSTNCYIHDINEAKNFLNAIDYKEIMNIKEYNTVYCKENFELAIKEILNGDILIEVETEENTNYNTIDKLKNVITNLEIPIQPNEFFIKKAEVELDKALNKMLF